MGILQAGTMTSFHRMLFPIRCSIYVELAISDTFWNDIIVCLCSYKLVFLNFHIYYCKLLYLYSGNRYHLLIEAEINGRHFADDIFKFIFLNENVWIPIKISLKFVPKGQINNIPALVQIMAWRRPGDKPLSEPMMVSLPTHICVTRPQWVNPWNVLHASYISVQPLRYRQILFLSNWNHRTTVNTYYHLLSLITCWALQKKIHPRFLWNGFIYPFTDLVNALWPGDTIWRQRYESTLVQVWLVVWQHQAITWTNIDQWPARSFVIYPGTQGTSPCYEFESLKLQMRLPGVNELNIHRILGIQGE